MKIILTYDQGKCHIELSISTSEKGGNRNLRLMVMDAIDQWLDELLKLIEKGVEPLLTQREHRVVKRISQHINKSVLVGELLEAVRHEAKQGRPMYHAVDRMEERRLVLGVPLKFYGRICTQCRQVFVATRRVRPILSS